jgi:hypothetical protein
MLQRRVVVLTGVVAVGLATTVAAADAVPTFTKDVAPILFKHCVQCHREGDIAPMALTTYEEARPWARSIKSKVLGKEMPPWGVGDTTLKFANDRSMAEQDIKTIVAWVDNGVPRGNPADLPPLPARATSQWKFDDPPDVVVKLPKPFNIPASGEIPFIDMYVPVPWKDGLHFIQKAEMRTKNVRVAHHIQVNVVNLPPDAEVVDGYAYQTDSTGKKIPARKLPLNAKTLPPELSKAFEGREIGRLEAGGFERIVTYTPGRGWNRYADGVGVPIQTGQFININLHYTPSGVPETDDPELGLWFVKGPTKQMLYVGAAVQDAVVNGSPVDAAAGAGTETERRARGALPPIPPFMANYTIDTVLKVADDISIWGFVPHMHQRGKFARFEIVYPDGQQRLLLEVPRYRYDWQERYELSEPLRVPKGSIIKAHTIFDNSLANRNNPAPDRQVFWSEQTWDEMNVPQFDYTVDRQDLAKMLTITRR